MRKQLLLTEQNEQTTPQTNVQTIKIHIAIQNVSKQTPTSKQKRKAVRNIIN